ncbi:protein kinase [Planctomycetota bacterium]
MRNNDKKEDKRPGEQELRQTASFDSSVTGPGGQIGPFRIERELGRGAVGIVYLAHDTKLDRHVAIKSLPAEIMANPKARSRFSREARLLASVNHPNIATIHEVIEEAEGLGYLVLEYVPGQTLAERIAKSKLKLREALTIASQIAEAVAAAHEHGVIHRDLKPGNIKITPEGKVKVLDFGLAKAVGGEAADQHSTITEPGRVIGTPAYMSPEQARGQETDKRSDIWSFGCVLYEMLTATVPFKGETVSDTLANILQTEPDWDKLPESTPDNVKVLIRRCMEKDQQRRLRDIGDAALEISETMHMPQIVPPVTSFSVLEHPPKRYLKWILAISWIAFVLVILVLIWQRNDDKANQSNHSAYYNIIPDRDAPFEPIGNVSLRWGLPALTISPNGKTLVYVAKVSNDTMLYKRAIGSSFACEPLLGTEGAFHPFFSPHGDWVGFFTKTTLKKVSISNGSVVVITDVKNPRGADWGVDGRILVSHEQGSTLSIVNENGDNLKKIQISQDNSVFQDGPEILPDGKTALIDDIYRGIRTVDLETGVLSNTLINGTNPKYLRSGHVLFAKNDVLHIVKFDSRKLEKIGPEKPLNINARIEAPFGRAQVDISDNGTLVYSPGKSLLNSKFVWRHRTGEEQELNIEEREFGQFRLSPDGKKMAVQIGNRKPGIWIYDNLDKLYATERNIGEGYYPLWSKDSNSIAYMSESNGTFKILKQSISGTDKPLELHSAKEVIYPAFLSLNDDYLVYGMNWDLYLKELSSGTDRDLLIRDGQDIFLSLSRDGKYMANLSDETGRYEVYVIPFPKADKIIPISSSGADTAIWARSKDELFYRNDNQWYQVSYTTDPEFKVTEISELFEGDYLRIDGMDFDVSADGEKFLLLKSVDESFDPYRLNIITNWFEELKRLAPTGKD